MREALGSWKATQGLLEHFSNSPLLSRNIVEWGLVDALDPGTAVALVESCSHLELSQTRLCFEDGEGPCSLVSHLPGLYSYMGHLTSATGRERQTQTELLELVGPWLRSVSYRRTVERLGGSIHIWHLELSVVKSPPDVSQADL